MPTTKTPADSLARLNFRLPSEALEKIERAAVAEGLTVTEFAVRALTGIADDALERRHTRRLSSRDRDVLLKMLAADDEPNAALKEALRIHRELIVE